MFDDLIKQQFAALRPELETMTMQAVTKVFAAHGFRPNRSDTAMVHNTLNTQNSCVIDLVNEARTAADALIHASKTEKLHAVTCNTLAGKLRLHCDRVEQMYRATISPIQAGGNGADLHKT